MRASLRRGAVALLALFTTASAAQAQPMSWTRSFWKVYKTANNPDFQSGIDGGVVTGLLNPTLSAGFTPTRSAMASTRVAGSGG